MSPSSEGHDAPRASRLDSPICMTRPNTEVLSTVLQFQRLCLNWYWHSLMPVLAPSPMYTMWSWYSWQSLRWPGDSPERWLHSGWAPMMYISGRWMGFIANDLPGGIGKVNIHSRNRSERLMFGPE